MFRKTTGPVDLRDYRELVELDAGRRLAPSRRPGQHVDGREPHPARMSPTRMPWRTPRGPASLADRGRVGVAAAAASTARLRWGDEFAPRADDGQHLAGPVPLAEPAARRLRGHLSGRSVRANGYGLYDWPGTSGMDRRPSIPSDGEACACCAPRRRRRRCAPTARREPAVIKGGSTCARRTTACATGPPPVRRRRSTRRPATSGFAASSAVQRTRAGPRLRRHVEDDEEQDDDVNPGDEQDALDQLLCLRVGRALVPRSPS